MTQKHKNLVAEELKIDAFDGLKTIWVNFSEVFNSDGLVFDFLLIYFPVDLFVALCTHVLRFEFQGIFDELVAGLLLVFGGCWPGKLDTYTSLTVLALL